MGASRRGVLLQDSDLIILKKENAGNSFVFVERVSLYPQPHLFCKFKRIPPPVISKGFRDILHPDPFCHMIHILISVVGYKERAEFPVIVPVGSSRNQIFDHVNESVIRHLRASCRMSFRAHKQCIVYSIILVILRKTAPDDQCPVPVPDSPACFKREMYRDICVKALAIDLPI